MTVDISTPTDPRELNLLVDASSAVLEERGIQSTSRGRDAHVMMLYSRCADVGSAGKCDSWRGPSVARMIRGVSAKTKNYLRDADSAKRACRAALVDT